MSAFGQKLRRTESGYWHWCPACGSYHPIGPGWAFNNDPEAPTFSPSVRQHLSGGKSCHYFLTAGELQFCADSAKLAGQTVPLPDFPLAVAAEWGL